MKLILLCLGLASMSGCTVIVVSKIKSRVGVCGFLMEESSMVLFLSASDWLLALFSVLISSQWFPEVTSPVMTQWNTSSMQIRWSHQERAQFICFMLFVQFFSLTSVLWGVSICRSSYGTVREFIFAWNKLARNRGSLSRQHGSGDSTVATTTSFTSQQRSVMKRYHLFCWGFAVTCIIITATSGSLLGGSDQFGGLILSSKAVSQPLFWIVLMAFLVPIYVSIVYMLALAASLFSFTRQIPVQSDSMTRLKRYLLILVCTKGFFALTSTCGTAFVLRQHHTLAVLWEMGLALQGIADFVLLYGLPRGLGSAVTSGLHVCLRGVRRHTGGTTSMSGGDVENGFTAIRNTSSHDSRHEMDVEREEGEGDVDSSNSSHSAGAPLPLSNKGVHSFASASSKVWLAVSQQAQRQRQNLFAGTDVTTSSPSSSSSGRLGYSAVLSASPSSAKTSSGHNRTFTFEDEDLSSHSHHQLNPIHLSSPPPSPLSPANNSSSLPSDNHGSSSATTSTSTATWLLGWLFPPLYRSLNSSSLGLSDSSSHSIHDKQLDNSTHSLGHDSSNSSCDLISASTDGARTNQAVEAVRIVKGGDTGIHFVPSTERVGEYVNGGDDDDDLGHQQLPCGGNRRRLSSADSIISGIDVSVTAEDLLGY